MTDPGSARPVVSVIVPFHDSELHLRACLDSLVEQEQVGGAVELLLVDNGSSDGSRRIAERCPGARVLREDTPGAYAARNAGILRARAPVLAFTDADCAVDRDWLRAILGGLEDPAVGALVGHCRYPREASMALRLLGDWENAKAELALGRLSPVHRFAWANNLAVRASLFAEIGPFRDWRRAGDTEWIHRLGARRPDLRTEFLPTMRVTHLEFVRARDRYRRLALYTRTNARIPTFRELGMRQRARAALILLGGLLRRRPR